MTATPTPISTDCAACAMPLRDEVDARAGLDQTCRAMFGYRKISSLSEDERREANWAIHAIAQNSIRGGNLRNAIFRLYELGFTDMAKRIERRVGSATREGIVEAAPPALPTPPIGLPPSEFVIDIPSPTDSLRPLPFEPTQGQATALTAVREMMRKRGHAVTIVVGYAGTGKAQPLTSIVYTPDGPRSMGEIRPGDWVCTPRGGRARVTGVFPQGSRPVWRFTLDDGAQVESCEDHLWVVKDRTRSSNLAKWKTDTRKLTTKYIVGKINTNTRGHQRFYLPSCAPLDFAARDLPIDPYLLGLLLGDGQLGTSNRLGFSCAKNSPLLPAIAALLAPWGHTLKTKNGVDHVIQGGLVKRGAAGHARWGLALALEDLQLWKRNSATKFVPSVYWYASVEQRRALLQGLMDTDGTVDRKTGVPSFCTTSSALRDAVVWLVRSLGGRATVSTKQPHCSYRGTRREGKLAYIINISSDDSRQLFRLDRKRAICRSRAFPLHRAIRTAEYVGELPVQCIHVDDPDHLYVTDGVAPTHNTAMILFVAHEHGVPVCVASTGKASLRIREATGLDATTIHRLIYHAVEDPKTGLTSYKRRTPDEIEMMLPRSRLLVLDESSMVGPDVWRDVIAVAQQHALKLLCIGDGFQLPPVQPPNAPPFSILAPEFAAQLNAQRVELTEVLRQAQDSPIIRASMMLRRREGIRSFNEIQKIAREQIASTCLAVHQRGGITICHKNVTRFKVNAGLRQMLGVFDELPQEGEPLLCLKNTYEAGLVNGETLLFPGWSVRPEQPEVITDRWKPGVSELAHFGAIKINGKNNAVLAVEELHGRLTLSMKAISATAAKWAHRENLYSGDAVAPHVAANFGYAFTAHKSQGSSFKYVFVVIEPSIRLNEEEGARWCYTAITRAEEAVAVHFGGF